MKDEEEKRRQTEDAQDSDGATNISTFHRFGSDDEWRFDLVSMLKTYFKSQI